MQESRSDKFLNSFNKIDQYLKDLEGYDSYIAFSHKIKDSKNPIVKRFQSELLSFGELRNAIVHNPKIGGEAIAEPHSRIVERIEAIYLEISNPKKVIPKFQSTVFGAKIDEPINKILVKMREHSFSQFPIIDQNNRIVELINTNTISRWLSSNLDSDGSILVENVLVKDLIQEIEFKNNYKYIARKASIYEAHDLFMSHLNRIKNNLDVIFITENGKQNEKLMGIITIGDIAGIY